MGWRRRKTGRSKRRKNSRTKRGGKRKWKKMNSIRIRGESKVDNDDREEEKGSGEGSEREVIKTMRR